MIKKILKLLRRFSIFFLMIAFVITSCMMLFVVILVEHNHDVVLTAETVGDAAKLTFLNVILLSVVFTAIDTVRRKITVDRPVKKITEAAEKIVKGDFSVRIGYRIGHRIGHRRVTDDDTFGRIIDCFNEMAEELGGVETLRTDFIANVSHEMKTPLAVIRNYGALLASPNLSDEKRIEYAEGIVGTSRRMADMVTNILNLNRLENQQIYPNLTEFDLGEQICEYLLMYEEVWERRNIEIENDIADDIRIKADAELLGHVWQNLFSNAFRFTPDGGKVGVKLTADERYAIVSVSDSGCGMTAEVGEHIFEKFYQGDSSHSGGGNGLGLALVKRVIDIVHGEISVESDVGRGSVFTVKIPRG